MTREEERQGREGGSYATTTYSTMVFTATQITAFFTEATQVGISTRTHQTLYDEGISTVEDLHELYDD